MRWYAARCMVDLICCATFALAGDRIDTVKRIEIESSAWNGRKIIRQTLVIRVTNTGHIAKNQKIDSDVLRDLLVKISSPPQPLTLGALGVDRDWLSQNAHAALGPWKNRLSPTQIDNFIGAFTNEATFLRAAKRYYTESVILDDDAEFKLEFVQVDGSRFSLRSSQSQAYMLPWEVTTPTQRFETYDAGISRAITRLLPNGFLNSLRIEGRPHGWDFGYEIGSAMETPLPQQ
jgi:hypothetical protein